MKFLALKPLLQVTVFLEYVCGAVAMIMLTTFAIHDTATPVTHGAPSRGIPVDAIK
jgi:hypothetical protein